MSEAPFPSFTKSYHQSPYPDIATDNPAVSAAGKVVFITGGGGGIGRAIAAAFIDAGATAVLLVGRTESTLKEAKSELSSLSQTTSVDYYVADITNPESVSEAFSTAVRLYGKVDILINNAGYLSVHTTLVDSPLDDYWRGFEINIKGPIITTQGFLKIAEPGATLINVASGAGHISYIPEYSGYSAAKLAAAKITEYVHYENPKLRVFNLQPGVIDTNMAKKAAMDVEKYDDPGEQLKTQ
jgi:NAD(P)-dependent dehydrogenase (short-subunit alcohol dehydrogenase family)